MKLLKEEVNMMLLQEREKVTQTLKYTKVEIYLNYMMDPRNKIVNVSKDL